jgi:hypothetical protein
MEPSPQPLTFIVRLTLSDGGTVSGVVERVRSGEKQRFQGVGELAEVVGAMVEREIERLGRKGRGA